MTTIKRVREVDDEPTSVQIIYKLLSRKSKKKLEELLHQWSEWHAQECSLSEDSDEDLESGEETYLPALNVTSDKSCTIFVYMDNQVNKKQRTEDAEFTKLSAPVYDRNYGLLMTNDEVANKESVLDIMNASRCFNCDAYDHSLKECTKPLNKEVVNNARKLHQSKSNRPSHPRVLTRYYQNTPGGKFDGLKPGCLDIETRKLLCLGEFDPPPWLNRMRKMGYPPGYLDLEDDDQPSGIMIFSNGDTKEENEKCVNSNLKEPKRKMTVDFPGINAPIPVNANKTRWAAHNSRLTGFKSCSNNIKKSLNHRVESENLTKLHFKRDSYEQRWRPECARVSIPLVSRGKHNYARGFPLLSNYANRYWDHIHQSNPRNYSMYQ